jgi:hypothetical protein
MPMPRGNRPSMAAFTSVGERKASEIVMLTCRMLHFSRVAICSTSTTAPVTVSSSQRRPQAPRRAACIVQERQVTVVIALFRQQTVKLLALLQGVDNWRISSAKSCWPT